MGFGLRVNLVFLSCFSFLGITGNASVIFLILRKFRLESWTYILVCHLAVSDLLSSAIGAPLWVGTYVTKDFNVCKAALFSSTIPIIVSSFTLILIAYDRYIFIRYPLRHPYIVKTRNVIVSLTFVWFLALFSAFLSITVGLNTESATTVRYCVSSLLVNRWVLIWVFSANTLMPIIALVIMYSYILRTALRQQRKIQQFSSIEEKRAKSTRLRRERQTIFMLCTVVLAFVVSVVPYSVVALLDAIDRRILIGKRLAYLTSLLLYFNAVINPLIYTLTNRELRSEAVKIFRRKTRVFMNVTSG